MKALILAGGKGTRLYPTTEVYNKHMIHVYDKPMIMHSIETLKKSGIEDIIISLSKDKPELFIEYLKDGSDFGLNFTYIIQNDSKGIAYAIYHAKHLLENDDKFMVYLADNYFDTDLSVYKHIFEKASFDCMILTKKSRTPERYGVISTDENNKLLHIIEKPKTYVGDQIVLGAYFFTKKFFELFNYIKPSKRNEYEITDIIEQIISNTYYCTYRDTWFDLGTSDDIIKCSIHLMNKSKSIINK